MQQTEKHARFTSSKSPLSNTGTSLERAEHILAKSIENETAIKLSEVTLTNQKFVNESIPLITEKVMELAKTKMVDILVECLKPYIFTMKYYKVILKDAELSSKKRETESLKNRYRCHRSMYL